MQKITINEDFEIQVLSINDNTHKIESYLNIKLQLDDLIYLNITTERLIKKWQNQIKNPNQIQK